MKLLILSCNTGGGHNSASKALEQAAIDAGHQVEVLDYLDFYSPRTNRLVCNFYVEAARYLPGSVGFFYAFGKLIHKLIPKSRKSPLYAFSVSAAKKFGRYLEEHPADCIICTHILNTEAITWLKNQGKKVPYSISISTDYTCVPFWNEGHCDRFVIPHELLTPSFLKSGIRQEEILPLGIPVDRRFSDLPNKADARKSLQLPADGVIHLVMGGSMGAGKIGRLTKLLLPKIPNDYLVVVCGSNQKLYQKLNRRYANRNNLRLLQYSEEIPAYFAACDILYSKPGGLTSTEALVAHIPLIHLAPIPGWESENVRFFAENGLSMGAKTLRKQIKAGVYLSAHPEKREELRRNQQAYAKPDCAKDLVKALECGLSQTDQTEAVSV